MEESAPFLAPSAFRTNPQWDSLKASIESSDEEKKIQVMRDLIQFQSSGDRPPSDLIISVINYALKTKNHLLKRLFYLYFEIVQTKDEKGEMKAEFILICDQMKNDLKHANEYIRAAALRFMSRFKEEELVSPNISEVLNALSMDVSPYVRRHAIISLGRIYKSWPHLAQDAPDEIANLLRAETDPACKRTAFLVLCDISKDHAASFLDDIVAGNPLSMTVEMQLTAAILIKNLCADRRKSSYFQCLVELIESPSPAVRMEAATTLLSLASTEKTAQLCFSTLCSLIQTIPNVTLQLSIADQIERFIPTHTQGAQSIVGDLLVAMKARSIRLRLLELVERLVNASNAVEVTTALVQQIKGQMAVRQNENEAADAAKFILAIVRVLRGFIGRYSKTSEAILEAVRPLLVDDDSNVSYEAIMIIRSLAASNERMRDKIAVQLENALPLMVRPRVVAEAVFIISVLSRRADAVAAIIDAFKAQGEQETMDDPTTAILPDGTYVTIDSIRSKAKATTPRELMLMDHTVCASAAMAVARLCLRLPNADRAAAMEFVQDILKLKVAALEQRRIIFAMSAIANAENPVYREIIVDATGEGFDSISDRNAHSAAVNSKPANTTQPDGRISFGGLLGRRFDAETKVARAPAGPEPPLIPLSGTSDPIYAEAKMRNGKFDIGLEVKLTNQTAVTLTDVCLHIYCVGKLELVDRGQRCDLLTDESRSLHFSVKVTSAQAGTIYGAVEYNISNDDNTGRQIIPIKPISISPIEYMTPATISDVEYRHIWDSFEWEKKTDIHSTHSIREIANLLSNKLNMKLQQEIDDDLPIACLNLYSVSAFGEEALINLSLQEDGSFVNGFLRLRIATREMAVSYARLINQLDI